MSIKEIKTTLFIQDVEMEVTVIFEYKEETITLINCFATTCTELDIDLCDDAYDWLITDEVESYLIEDCLKSVKSEQEYYRDVAA